LGILMLLLLLFFTRLRNKLKSERERVESSRRIIGIEENEKRKLSMDLHDLSGQVKMELLEHFSRINIPEGTEKTEMTATIKNLSNHIRTISHRMSRITIDQFEIGTLIKGLCDEFREFSGLDIQLSCSNDVPDLNDEARLHVFRILQEILTNAAKYAKDAHIKIEISVSGGNFTMVYSDNGQGFDTAVTKNIGMGFTNIHERAKILGGNAMLESSPGLGVFWEITIPLIMKK
jgi:signal transduction histidine kinase